MLIEATGSVSDSVLDAEASNTLSPGAYQEGMRNDASLHMPAVWESYRKRYPMVVQAFEESEDTTCSWTRNEQMLDAHIKRILESAEVLSSSTLPLPPFQPGSLRFSELALNIPRTAIGSQAHGPPGANVFVFHIPNEWDEHELAIHFAQFGPILSARIATEKATGRRLGFGFVSYTEVEPACRAVNVLNGFPVAGKRLKVTIKRGEQQHITSRLQHSPTHNRRKSTNPLSSGHQIPSQQTQQIPIDSRGRCFAPHCHSSRTRTPPAPITSECIQSGYLTSDRSPPPSARRTRTPFIRASYPPQSRDENLLSCVSQFTSDTSEHGRRECSDMTPKEAQTTRPSTSDECAVSSVKAGSGQGRSLLEAPTSSGGSSDEEAATDKDSGAQALRRIGDVFQRVLDRLDQPSLIPPLTLDLDWINSLSSLLRTPQGRHFVCTLLHAAGVTSSEEEVGVGPSSEAHESPPER